MTEVLLILLFVACLSGMAIQLRKRDGVYLYAFLGAGVFLGFVALQLVGLMNDPLLPSGALDKTAFMAILCLLMVYAGAKAGSRPFIAFDWKFSERRLLIASAVLSFVGGFFYVLIGRLPVDMVSVSQWTGTVVAYRFFVQAATYGLAIALMVYLNSSSKIALGIIGFALFLYGDRIFLNARRGETAEVLAIILLGLWFKKGIVLSRALAVCAMVLGTLFIYSTGEYRLSAVTEPILNSISEINFRENLARVWNEGGPELENAIFTIEAVERNSGFDYGAFHWNTLVFNYVPAQIVGMEFKESLMFASSDRAQQEFGHVGPTGSTETGVADAFRSFWYFGAFKFFVIAYVLARIYRGAIAGNFVMHLLYMLMLVNGLHAITHNTNWFVSPWLHIAIFLVPTLLFARSGRDNGAHRSEAVMRRSFGARW